MKILEIAGTGGVGVGYMGPITTVITGLSNAFAALGCDVTVADARTTDRRIHVNTDMVNVIELESPVWPENTEISSIRRFIKELSRQNLHSYDVVHTHDPVMAAHLQAHLGIDCAYTVHTPQGWAHPGLPFRRRVSDLLRRAAGSHEYNVIQNCRLTIALGKFLREFVRGGNIKVIQNGTNLARWRRIEDARATLGIAPDDFVALYVGRLEHRKGCHLLLEAVKKLGFRENFQAIVVGRIKDDPYCGRLASLAEDQPVTFAGFVSNQSDRFLEYLSVADVLVVPSLFDNQPTTVLEGLAMGVPVIGSSAGGIPDMVSPEVGLVFEAGNANQLAGHIRKLYAAPTLRGEMASRARQYVSEKYTWDVCAKQYIAEFENMR